MFVDTTCHNQTYMEEKRKKELQVFKTADTGIQKTRNLQGNKESKHSFNENRLLLHPTLHELTALYLYFYIAEHAGCMLATAGNSNISQVPNLSFFIAPQTSPRTNNSHRSLFSFWEQVIRNTHIYIHS